jgi:hypothetical protein
MSSSPQRSTTPRFHRNSVGQPALAGRAAVEKPLQRRLLDLAVHHPAVDFVDTVEADLTVAEVLRGDRQRITLE